MTDDSRYSVKEVALHALGLHLGFLPSPELPELVDFPHLPAWADIIFMHAPLTDTTAGSHRPEGRGLDVPRTNSRQHVARFVGGSGCRHRHPARRASGRHPRRLRSRTAGSGAAGEVPNLLATPYRAYYSEQARAESKRRATTQGIRVLTGEKPDCRVN